MLSSDESTPPVSPLLLLWSGRPRHPVPQMSSSYRRRGTLSRAHSPSSHSRSRRSRSLSSRRSPSTISWLSEAVALKTNLSPESPCWLAISIVAVLSPPLQPLTTSALLWQPQHLIRAVLLPPHSPAAILSTTTALPISSVRCPPASGPGWIH